MGSKPQIAPDTKDWTWVLSQSCDECGADVGAVDPTSVAEALRDNASEWLLVLAREGVTVRPAANVWSPLEYGCHVRDVHRVFDGRVRLMLEQDDPPFENWDQDAASAGYGDEQADVVARELAAAATAVAARYDGVLPQQWSRPGRRSNGSSFTVATIATYHLHDVVHHSWDVGLGPDRHPGGQKP